VQYRKFFTGKFFLKIEYQLALQQLLLELQASRSNRVVQLQQVKKRNRAARPRSHVTMVKPKADRNGVL
jgi:hypothetical protein